MFSFYLHVGTAMFAFMGYFIITKSMNSLANDYQNNSSSKWEVYYFIKQDVTRPFYVKYQPQALGVLKWWIAK